MDVRQLTVDDIRNITWDAISAMTFQEREILGRTIYRSTSPYDIEFTEDPYAKWDASVTGNSKTWNVEIKYRYLTPEKKQRYDEQGYWLEKTKYKALMDAYRETGSIPFFVTFISGGVGYAWNLLKLKPVWEWENATVTSAEGNYGKEKKPKLVCHPLPSEGQEFEW